MRTNDFARFHGRLTMHGALELVTPLRIGAGSSDDLGTADITVVKDALGYPYIPGSSFKGVLRTQVERLLRTIDEELACLCVTFADYTDDPPGSRPHCPTTLQQDALKARVNYLRAQDPNSSTEDGRYLDKIYLEETCAVCRVFGSTGLAAKVIIPDLNLEADEMSADGQWYGTYQVRHGVSIDRDTETAAEGRLYTSEAVPAGARFHCEIIVENGSPADQGLVLLGLRAFEKKLVTLGGGASRGLGQVQLTITDCREIPSGGEGLIEFLVSGASRLVDETARLAKISALRAELRDAWGIQDA
jgi:CRISPR-associated RAMP protein (TIGR02581 family)